MSFTALFSFARKQVREAGGQSALPARLTRSPLSTQRAPYPPINVGFHEVLRSN